MLSIRNIKSRLADQRGTAMVEFALVLPVLALLLFGIVDFGRLLNYWNDENQMAADGARFAAVNRNPSTSGQTLAQFIQGQADTAELRNGNGGSGNGVTSAAAVTIWTSGKAGDPVRVCVRSQYQFFNVVGIGPHITTHGSAVMRLEQDASNFTPDGAYRSDCP